MGTTWADSVTTPALIGGRKIALTLCAIELKFQLSNMQGCIEPKVRLSDKQGCTQLSFELSGKRGWTERNLALNDQQENIATSGGIPLDRVNVRNFAPGTDYPKVEKAPRSG